MVSVVLRLQRVVWRGKRGGVREAWASWASWAGRVCLGCRGGRVVDGEVSEWRHGWQGGVRQLVMGAGRYERHVCRRGRGE